VDHLVENCPYRIFSINNIFNGELKCKKPKMAIAPKICHQQLKICDSSLFVSCCSRCFFASTSYQDEVAIRSGRSVVSGFRVVRAVPSGFTERTIFEDPRMNDLSFTSDERMFVIQKMGLVSIREPGVNYQYEIGTTVLDIVEIVCERKRTRTRRSCPSSKL
jgi:hypothetical protein